MVYPFFAIEKSKTDFAYKLEDAILQKSLSPYLVRQIRTKVFESVKEFYNVKDVKELQGRLNIESDGVLGRGTIRALFEDLHKNNSNEAIAVLMNLRRIIYPLLDDARTVNVLGVKKAETLKAYGFEKTADMQRKLIEGNFRDYSGNALTADKTFGKRTLSALLSLVNDQKFEPKLAAVPKHTDTPPEKRQQPIVFTPAPKPAADLPVGKKSTLPTVKVNEEKQLLATNASTTLPVQQKYFNILADISDKRKKDPNLIVLHDTGGSTVAGAVNALRSRGYSSHYVIGLDGKLYQLVPEKRFAHHASTWNSRSIGIDIVSRTGKVEEYTEAQYRTLGNLMRDICQRYGIPYDNDHIKGHFQEKVGVDVGKQDPRIEWGHPDIRLPGHPESADAIAQRNRRLREIGRSILKTTKNLANDLAKAAGSVKKGI